MVAPPRDLALADLTDDLWLLAATAKIVGLTLATRNVADVERTGVELLDPFGD